MGILYLTQLSIPNNLKSKISYKGRIRSNLVRFYSYVRANPGTSLIIAFSLSLIGTIVMIISDNFQMAELYSIYGLHYLAFGIFVQLIVIFKDNIKSNDIKFNRKI
jgi:hypothetical protein